MVGKLNTKKFLLPIMCLALVFVLTTHPAASLQTHVMDYDYNNNGKIDNVDKSLLLEHLGESTSKWSSNRKFDNNYDGVIDESDVNLLDQSKGLELGPIADGMFTGKSTKLDLSYKSYVEQREWDFKLYALNKNYVWKYYHDWLDLRHHSYNRQSYSCGEYAVDMMKCSYKDLGYGAIAYAETNALGPDGHAYNMFYTGGDWHDLKNWVILDPTNNCMVRADKPTSGMYQTLKIIFPVEKSGSSNVTKGIEFFVHGNTVHKDTNENSFNMFAVGEEPLPTYYNRNYHPHQIRIPIININISKIRGYTPEVTAVGGLVVALFLIRRWS